MAECLSQHTNMARVTKVVSKANGILTSFYTFLCFSFMKRQSLSTAVVSQFAVSMYFRVFLPACIRVVILVSDLWIFIWKYSKYMLFSIIFLNMWAASRIAMLSHGPSKGPKVVCFF